jgi:glycosyltransferase involved in cell wall biosynthesis
MIRVLQLLDAAADYQSQSAVRQLSADASGETTGLVRTIGRGGNYSTLLRAVLVLRSGEDQFDLLHAWGHRALLVAAIASRKPIVYTPDRYPTGPDIRVLRAIHGARPLQTACSTDTIRRALVTRGLPAYHCHLIRPGVEFARINRRRDTKLRSALGFDESDYVLLACGESTRPAAHQLAVWATTILHVLEPRYRLLVWGRGDHADQVERFAIKTRQAGLISIAERALRRAVEFEQLLPAADAVLITATEPVATLSISICMAAGLPIVAVVSPTVAELLEDRHTCLMVRQPKPRLIAQRILDLQQDPGLQWSISDMARTEAYEFFSLSRMLSQHRTVYSQMIAGQPVNIPPPAPGAGLRFHGRG